MQTPTSGHHRLTVTVDYPDHDLVCAWLFSAGALGVETSGDTLNAWFDTASFQPSVLPTPPALANLSDTAWRFEPPHDWHAAWVETITPVTVGRFVVTPAWLLDTLDTDPAIITLIIDPAQAFGSGHHATTAMCLELLDEAASRHSQGVWQVADVGCGTGVLGIAAAKLGGDVHAVDTDPVAVRVTAENAAINAVTLHTQVGSVACLTIRPHTLIANLLSDTILSLAAELVATPTKELIVSGISRERFAQVRDQLVTQGATVLTVRERDGWVAATFVTANA